jgi:hypothetical protein
VRRRTSAHTFCKVPGWRTEHRQRWIQLLGTKPSSGIEGERHRIKREGARLAHPRTRVFELGFEAPAVAVRSRRGQFPAHGRTVLRGNQYGAPVPIDIILSTTSARHRERYSGEPREIHVVQYVFFTYLSIG